MFDHVRTNLLLVVYTLYVQSLISVKLNWFTNENHSALHFGRLHLTRRTFSYFYSSVANTSRDSTTCFVLVNNGREGREQLYKRQHSLQ